MPLISVIVPVYRVESFLGCCIDSILHQTFSDFELILIDDGSPDSCGKICDEYASKDNRIRVIHQNNRGVAVARNTGLEYVFSESNSQYLCFIDGDDWVHARFLELLYSAILKYDTISISQCLYQETSGADTNITVGNSVSLITSSEAYMDYYNACVWGKLYAKKVFQNLRFPNGKIYEDVAIWYSILFSQSQIGLVKEKLYFYRKRLDSITNSPWREQNLSQLKFWNKQLQFLKVYADKKVYVSGLNRCIYIYQENIIKIKNSSMLSSYKKSMYLVLVYQMLMKLKIKRRLLLLLYENQPDQRMI